MNEASKARARRTCDARYSERWIVGRVLDIGAGPDPLREGDWPRVTEVRAYDRDRGDKDAQFLPEIGDAEFDTVHSSHCLEHVRSTRAALTNWLRVLKPGGFLVCTVPEEFLYEGGTWPSRFNPDHKLSYTMRALPIIPSSENILGMLWKLPVDVEHVTLLTSGWSTDKFGSDQTLGPAECAIEFVVRKPDPGRPF